VRKPQKQSAGARADKRALAVIEGAGWTLTGVREGGVGRFVATKNRIEEDHSITKMYESSYTLVAVCSQVERREREESNTRRETA
jgi:hypothetical protein